MNLQILHYGRPEAGVLYDEDLAESVMMNTTAIIAELGEMLAEFPGWKPWTIDYSINRDAMVGELVDVLHFAANILTAVGCDDVELNLRYEAKMQKNRERMESGTYDAVSDKCGVCGREMRVSDIQVTTSKKDRIWTCSAHGIRRREALD